MVTKFAWDEGNWPKCGKHGVSKEEIEYVFSHRIWEIRDPYEGERRFRAVGRTASLRYVFVVYTLRGKFYEECVRPVSARYMHDKEIKRYEQATETIPRFSQ